MTTFHELLDQTVAGLHTQPRPLAHGECQSDAGIQCRLCNAVTHSYEDELRAKRDALEQFWSARVPDVSLDPLIPSPLGRAYRTISKRKAFTVRGATRLGLIDPEQEASSGRVEIQQCAIEPLQHAAIYSYLQSSLEKPHGKPLEGVLRHAIVKGSYTEFILILTVQEINQAVVRAANTVSKGLTRIQKDVIGVYLYEDRSRGGYYLGMSDQESPGRIHRIFGKKMIYHRLREKGFLLPPLAFSQINHSQLDALTSTAARLLSPGKRTVLYDLYCGYGLFSLMLAEEFRMVVGVEVSAGSIEAARENASRLGITNARFIRSNLSASTVLSVMREATPQAKVLLDPPRKGTSEGVIEAIASKRPAGVLHIFCNIELIPENLERWASCGYRPSSAVPVDMFPGTASMEVLILLERSLPTTIH